MCTRARERILERGPVYRDKNFTEIAGALVSRSFCSRRAR
jgi:hypothetical protein